MWEIRSAIFRMALIVQIFMPTVVVHCHQFARCPFSYAREEKSPFVAQPNRRGFNFWQMQYSTPNFNWFYTRPTDTETSVQNHHLQGHNFGFDFSDYNFWPTIPNFHSFYTPPSIFRTGQTSLSNQQFGLGNFRFGFSQPNFWLSIPDFNSYQTDPSGNMLNMETPISSPEQNNPSFYYWHYNIAPSSRSFRPHHNRPKKVHNEVWPYPHHPVRYPPCSMFGRPRVPFQAEEIMSEGEGQGIMRDCENLYAGKMYPESKELIDMCNKYSRSNLRYEEQEEVKIRRDCNKLYGGSNSPEAKDRIATCINNALNGKPIKPMPRRLNERPPSARAMSTEEIIKKCKELYEGLGFLHESDLGGPMQPDVQNFIDKCVKYVMSEESRSSNM